MRCLKDVAVMIDDSFVIITLGSESIGEYFRRSLSMFSEIFLFNVYELKGFFWKEFKVKVKFTNYALNSFIPKQ